MSERVSQIAAQLNYPKGMLAGQTAIVTGSGQGIGAEAARLFANEGAKVVIADIDATKAQSVADSINARTPGRALAVAGDILDRESITTLVERAAAAFGGGVVNNAGVHVGRGVLHQLRDAMLLAVHRTAFPVPAGAGGRWRRRPTSAWPTGGGGGGASRCVVNVGSTSGPPARPNYARPGRAHPHHHRQGVGPGGSACAPTNTVAFGHIATRLTRARERGAFVTLPDGRKVGLLGIPEARLRRRAGGDGKAAYPDIALGRPGTPSEAASATLAGCSPLFSYVTGQTIMVTGGRNM
ncbi:hypothetical protein F4780DRAFT_782354 [Xylariomycetidae sp. FL0641]|nr:hypothetical protein F4780DRAFT_782354 [Xylariomycetidae sp. FL0641]